MVSTDLTDVRNYLSSLNLHGEVIGHVVRSASATALVGLFESLKQTAIMVAASATLSTLIGLPLGVALVVTSPGQFLERPVFNRIAGTVVNLVRSTPFIILMVAIIPDAPDCRNNCWHLCGHRATDRGHHTSLRTACRNGDA